MLLKGVDGRAIQGLEGKLKVLASGIHRLHEEGTLGDAVVISTVSVAPTLTGTAAREPLLVIRNDSNLMDLVVDRISVSASAAMAFILRRNPVLGALGAQVAGFARNLNYANEKSLSDVFVSVWDETAGGITNITGGQDIATIFSGVGGNVEDTKGALILSPGRVLVVDKAAVAGEVSVNVYASLRPAGLFLPA
ncbi:MAG: hypothetical protein AB7V18_19160 [Pyrinomonadaceae bacterium]